MQFEIWGKSVVSLGKKGYGIYYGYLDPRLSISISKVRNVASVLKVPNDLFQWTSLLALLVVGTVPP